MFAILPDLTRSSDMPSCIEEYLELSRRQARSFGDRSVVLMEVGSFYEIYGTSEPGCVDVSSLCALLDIQETRKNKQIREISVTNPKMAGFPTQVVDKHVATLVANGWTVTLYDQERTGPNPTRYIKEVISPSTYVPEHEQRAATPLVMSVYVESGPQRVWGAISMMDMTRRDVIVLEEFSCKSKEDATDHVRTRAVCCGAKTVVMSYEDEPRSEEAAQAMKAHLNTRTQVFSCAPCKRFASLHTRSHLFEKVWGNETIMSVVERLGLETSTEAQKSLCELVSFAYLHDDAYVQGLPVPVWRKDRSYLHVNTNLLYHLDVLSQDSARPTLESMLNRCASAMGRREFRNRIASPLTHGVAIQERLDRVQHFVDHPEERTRAIDQMGSVYDIERIHRRAAMSRMTLQDILRLHATMVAMSSSDPAYTSAIVGAISSALDVEQCRQVHAPVFLPGTNGDIDAVQARIECTNRLFRTTVDELNAATSSGYFRLDHTDRDGYSITITTKRWNDISDAVARGYKPLTRTKTHTRVTDDGGKLSAANHALLCDRELLRTLQADAFAAIARRVRELLSDPRFDALCMHIKCTDVASACADTAVRMRHVRPLIKQRDTPGVRATGLRHPIIEGLLKQVRFVANDVSIGAGQECNGMLLYGVNSSGKSSYMKSVGIAIILAQAGMYVPAEDMELTPYRMLLSRISNGDDIVRGTSTFVGEMMDIRTILHTVDDHALVIGDEVCSGTETTSALSIVASCLEHFCNTSTQFVFATHLHELTGMGFFSGSGIAVKHMAVHQDDQGTITFDRRLVDGQGPSCYGLSVCKGLDLPSDFILRAEQHKKELQGIASNLVQKQSTYNRSYYVDPACKICSRTNGSVHVHHILYQSHADSQGYHGHSYKHELHNLVSVCEDCHTKIHRGEIDIRGYVQTTKGVQFAHAHAHTKKT